MDNDGLRRLSVRVFQVAGLATEKTRRGRRPDDVWKTVVDYERDVITHTFIRLFVYS